MITPRQTTLLHVAKAKLGLNEQQYRMILKNVADVISSKQLTQATFEDVMATLEDRGFRNDNDPEHWRNKVKARANGQVSERQLRYWHQLSAGTRYPLAAMARRLSSGRTDDPAQLSPQEAYALTEALKAAKARAERDAPQGQLFPQTAAADERIDPHPQGRAQHAPPTPPPAPRQPTPLPAFAEEPF